MDLSWCWLFGLVLTHAAAYLLGRGDGQAEQMEEQQPLTLEELHALIDAGDEVVIYCETEYDKKNIYGTIVYGERIYDRYGEAPGVKHMKYESYGKTWRAWASRPTDEERAAAPWES